MGYSYVAWRRPLREQDPIQLLSRLRRESGNIYDDSSPCDGLVSSFSQILALYVAVLHVAGLLLF